MDEYLRTYVLRPLGMHLADPDRLSEQARAVRAIILDSRLAGEERYRQVLEYFTRQGEVEPDACYWVVAVMRAHTGHALPLELKHAGGPLISLDAPSDFKIEFWQRLAQRFPAQGSFYAGWADELYQKLRMAGIDDVAAQGEVFELCIKAFELDPALTMLLSRPGGREWKQAGGVLFLRYRLAHMQALRNLFCLHQMASLAEDLRAEYHDDPPVMARVRSILGEYAGLAQENLRAILACARARLHEANEQYEQAIGAYNEALAIDPQYARAYFGRASSRGYLGDPDRGDDHDRGATIQHRQSCELFRVEPGQKRTTPRPKVDILHYFPRLVECAATTDRLHARYGPEPALDASKLGGLLLWPEDEPWPVCAEHHRMPYVGVLQLRAEDFPEMPFRPGSDLFQLLWCPQDHEMWMKPTVRWRKRADVARPRSDFPEPVPEIAEGEAPPKVPFVEGPEIPDDYLEHVPAIREYLKLQREHQRANRPALRPQQDYLPTPCLLLPEQVIELPEDPEELPPELRQILEQPLDEDRLPIPMKRPPWGAPISGLDFYGALRLTCPGSKVGGHPRWIQGPEVPQCRCGRPMEHLLTLSSEEGDALSPVAWLPAEEHPFYNGYVNDALDGTERAHGMKFGDLGAVYFFVCRHCPAWPVRHVGQCS